MDPLLYNNSVFSGGRSLVQPLSKILHAFHHPIDLKDLRVCVIGTGAESILAGFISQFLHGARVVVVAADQQFLDFACKGLGIKPFFVPPANHVSAEAAVVNGCELANGLYDALGIPPGWFDIIFECNNVDAFVHMAHRLRFDNPQGNTRSVLLHDNYTDDLEIRSMLEDTDPNSCAGCRTVAIDYLQASLIEYIKWTIVETTKKKVVASPATTLVGEPSCLTQKPGYGLSGQSNMWLSERDYPSEGLSPVVSPPSDQSQDPPTQYWTDYTNVPPPDELQVPQAPDSPLPLYEHGDANCPASLPLFSPNRRNTTLPVPVEFFIQPQISLNIQDSDLDANLPTSDFQLPLGQQMPVQEQISLNIITSPLVSIPLTRSSTLATWKSFSDQSDALSPQASTVTDSPVVPANQSFVGKFRLPKRSCSCPNEAQKKARHERVCPDNPNRADNDILCPLPGCGTKIAGGRKDNLKRHMAKQHSIDA